jgi:hypothetical protein
MEVPEQLLKRHRIIKLDTVLVLPYSAQSADIARDTSWLFARGGSKERGKT